jgi:hypothetical protein
MCADLLQESRETCHTAPCRQYCRPCNQSVSRTARRYAPPQRTVGAGRNGAGVNLTAKNGVLLLGFPCSLMGFAESARWRRLRVER